MLQGIEAMLNVCVPVFIALSALMYARSEAKKMEGWKAVPKRFWSLAHPFLVFTAFYSFVSVRLAGAKFDPYKWIIWGKSYFHLYFMVILMQLALTLPLWVLLAKRIQKFWIMVATGILLQALVMFLQRTYQFLPFPGSSELWYVIQISVSVWLGMDWSNRQPELQKLPNRVIFGVLVLIGGAIFGYEQCLMLAKLPIHGNWSNYGMQAMQFGTAMLFFGVLGHKELKSPVSKLIVQLGGVSMALYFMHPAVMELPRILAPLGRFMGLGDQLAYWWVRFWPLYLFGTIVLTLGFARLIKILKLDRVIFGRSQ